MASRDLNDYVGNSDPEVPDSNDQIANWDDELRQAKNQARNSFPNVTGAVTASHDELNKLDGFTGDVATQASVTAAQTAADNAQSDIDSYPDYGVVARDDVENTFDEIQYFEKNIVVKNEIYLGDSSASSGDSRSYYRDTNSNAWRVLMWDNSWESFVISDNSGQVKRVIHEGNLTDFETDYGVEVTSDNRQSVEVSSSTDWQDTPVDTTLTVPSGGSVAYTISFERAISTGTSQCDFRLMVDGVARYEWSSTSTTYELSNRSGVITGLSGTVSIVLQFKSASGSVHAKVRNATLLAFGLPA